MTYQPTLEDKLAEVTSKVRRAPSTEVEQGTFAIINLDPPDRSLITFVEDNGYLILRVTVKGQSSDLILNQDQIKLLLRQMILWITK